MTSTTQLPNRLNASFRSRTPAQSSIQAAPSRQVAPRSFITVLLRCLSAFNA